MPSSCGRPRHGCSDICNGSIAPTRTARTRAEMTTPTDPTIPAPGTGGSRISAVYGGGCTAGPTPVSVASRSCGLTATSRRAATRGLAAVRLHHAVGAPRGARHHRPLQPGEGGRECVRGPRRFAHEARRRGCGYRPRSVRHHRGQRHGSLGRGHCRLSDLGDLDRTALPGRLCARLAHPCKAVQPTSCATRSGSSSSAGCSHSCSARRRSCGPAAG